MQTLRRKRLGNVTEDIAVFSAPLLANATIAAMDGYDVLNLQTTPLGGLPGKVLPPSAPAPTAAQAAGAQPALGPIGRPAPRLFDVLGLGTKGSPRGITYATSRNLFVVNDPMQPTKLFFTDGRGVPRGSINIQYPQDQPRAVEGLTYIPANAREFPDSIVMVATFKDDNSPSLAQSRLEIINLSGGVIREIVPQGDLGTLFLTGVCFKTASGNLQGNSLLVSSDDDNTIYELDFKGQQLSQFSPPLKEPGFNGIEGLVQIPTGEIAAANGFAGFLEVFGANDVPAPQAVDYRIGFGLSLLSGLAWDSTTNEFLAICLDRLKPDQRFIARVAPAFDSFRLSQTADVFTRKVTYLGDEQLLAVTHARNPRGIQLFTEQGQPAGVIDTTTLGAGPPVILTYIPTLRQFGLVFRDQPDQSKLTRINRDGTVAPVPIDFAPAGIQKITALTFFNPKHPSGGQFLVFDNTQDLFVVTDFAGMRLGQAFSIRDTLRVLNPTAATTITTGPDAGAFAISNAENSELVVFRLD